MDLSKYSVAHFDRGATRSREIAWWIVNCTLFQVPWPLPSAIRVGLLRWFGAKIGHHVVIRANVHISFPWRLVIGDYVWIGDEAKILSLALVTVESNVCISQRAYLCTGTHNFYRETFDLQTKPITLREGCWVAAQAFVGPGVEIGAGSVVAAGSVVFENVPPNCLVQGNPAKVLKPITRTL